MVSVPSWFRSPWLGVRWLAPPVAKSSTLRCDPSWCVGGRCARGWGLRPKALFVTLGCRPGRVSATGFAGGVLTREDRVFGRRAVRMASVAAAAAAACGSGGGPELVRALVCRGCEAMIDQSVATWWRCWLPEGCRYCGDPEQRTATL